MLFLWYFIDVECQHMNHAYVVDPRLLWCQGRLTRLEMNKRAQKCELRFWII